MAEAIHSSSRPRDRWPSLTPSPEVAHAIRAGIAVGLAIWIGKAPGLVENGASSILVTVGQDVGVNEAMVIIG